ncbi:MAG: short-chain dehydrogenase [Opitutus sp.]|nr:short-chain dehydrogenase [Opitutus sp.]
MKFPVLLALFFVLGSLCGCAHGPGAPATSGRVVVLTGASSGFGRGVALQLASRGDRLVLAARRTELLESLTRECEQRGGRAVAVTTDVADAAQVARLAEVARREFGRIDVWINNAGVGAIGRFDETPLRDHDRIIDVNVKGVIHGSHVALRQFRQQGHGVLINVSSVTGRTAFAYQASYSASKHAVRALGAAIHEELRANGERGIEICTIFPYAADTPWWPNAANYTGQSPRMILIDPPGKVIAAIVRATTHPRREISVGWKAKVLHVFQRVTPTLTEWAGGKIAHDQFVIEPPPAPTGSGNLHEPGPIGGIDGGVREKIKFEDAAREPDGLRDGG